MPSRTHSLSSKVLPKRNPQKYDTDQETLFQRLPAIVQNIDTLQHVDKSERNGTCASCAGVVGMLLSSGDAECREQDARRQGAPSPASKPMKALCWRRWVREKLSAI